MFFEIWIFGHVETAPMPISPFSFLNFEKLTFWEIDVFCRFQGPTALCVCVAAACGASAPSEKHTPGFVEHVSCGFCVFLSISGPPKPFAAVSQLPAALRLPQKNTLLDLLSMYLVDLVNVHRFLGSPSTVWLSRSCLRRFSSLKKTHTWIFLEHISCGFCNF